LLLALAGLLGLVAVLIASQAVRLKPVRQVRLVQAPTAVLVDAAGCPAGVSCRIGSTAPPALLAAINRALPSAAVQSVTGVYDSATGWPYRITVSARIGIAAHLTVIAQRLPGAPVNDPEAFDGSSVGHDDLSGNLVIDSRFTHAVVPGRPGCTIQLTLSSRGSGDAFDDAALRLARDPDLQLTP
jgi:hypothetical protein